MENAIEMAKSLMVESIWKSANVEGLGTTLARTEAILNNAITTVTREEVFFVVNMKRAWEFLLDNIDFPSNLMFARELNKICGDGLFKGNGDLRTSGVTIGGTTWAPEIPQTGVVEEELRRINDIEDPLDRALEAFCYMARTQAFIDGNKRVAQLLANHILIKANIGVLGIPVDLEKNFKVELVCYYETNDSKALKSFLEKECITKVSSVIEQATNPMSSLEQRLISVENSERKFKNGIKEDEKELKQIRAELSRLKNEKNKVSDRK